jgi:serine/threonine protein kinase
LRQINPVTTGRQGAEAYRLGKRIAMGGMAEVYLGIQQGLGGFEKLVVIKRILPHLQQDGQFVQMFLDEAKLAAALRHPGIVSILDLHRDEESFFVVMEWLRGEDARLLLRRQRNHRFRIPFHITGHIASSVADALHHAHTATDSRGRPLGLIHRDVAPSNIIVNYDGQTKLIDFGIAKANAHSTYTTPGTIKGKYAYTSPEQIHGKPLDGRSDVFALGVVLHELLTGKRLFKGESPATTLKSVLSEPIPRPSELAPDVPPELDALVMGALERDRADRTESALVFRDQLREVFASLGLKAQRKDVAEWMTTTLSKELEGKRALERDAVEAAREGRAATAPFRSSLPHDAPKGVTPHSDISSSISLLVPSDPSVSDSLISRSSAISRASQISGVKTRRRRSRRRKRSNQLLIALIAVVAVLLVVLAFLIGRTLAAPGPAPQTQQLPFDQESP